MKTSELKKCCICRKGMAHAGHITFWTLSVQRMALNRQSINRVDGMEQFFGGELAIARVFCDEDIAVKVGESINLFVCEECAIHKRKALWELTEETEKTEETA